MVAYIKEIEELKFKHKILNTIQEENISGKDIFLLPIKENTKTKKSEKVITRLIKKLHDKKIKYIVLSNELLKNNILKENLINNKIDILDGRILYRILLSNIIDTICYYKNTNIQKEKITILVDETNEINLNNILEIAQKAKTVNIVTNFSYRFNKIINYLYEELGILIRISNNIKRDLVNSNIIINIDFNALMINRYYINTRAIILNIPPNIEIASKKFTGININSYNIIIPEGYKLNNFDDKYVYEAAIKNKTITEIQKQIRKEKIKIKNLVGKNGIINKNEFLSI